MAVLEKRHDDSCQLLVSVSFVEFGKLLGLVSLIIFFLVLENFLLDYAHALIEYHDKLPIGVFELAAELDIHVARDESPCDKHKPQCPVCCIETYDYAAVARTRLDIVRDTLIQDCHHENEDVDN